LTKTTG